MKTLPSLGLNKDMSTYNYLSGGKLTINNVDDFKEFNLLVEAFKIMGFTTNEMNFIYQVLAIILHLGNTLSRHGNPNKPISRMIPLLIEYASC